ncbi:uncharacterized protein LOC119605587 [Lucilia sericata]|uniref:uncharacterized protein LOC119605587 n=1 Tax=Lucilia sericata TaxID=13632 RepID=UPI0018A80753|nr:uncharacterized protein LOC119605587 [Lucilia sericata]
MSSRNTNISTIENCFQNIELVKNICQFLTYEQQLQLLRVSEELEYIITNFVWNKQFKEVEVYVLKKCDKYLISNKIDTEASSYNRYVHIPNLREIFSQTNILLEKSEMEIFFNLNAKNIQKLHFKLNADIQRDLIKLPPIEKFTNLTYFRCEKVILSNRDVKNLAKNCLKLETLDLFNCRNIEGQPLVLDKDIDVSVLQNMANLKNLFINYTDWCDGRHLYNFSNVQHILQQLQLQRFGISCTIESDEYADKEDLNFSSLSYYQAFEIGPCDVMDFLEFQSNILPKFENLAELTINDYKSITTDFFNILLGSCKNLFHLSFNKCYFHDFISLPKLKELGLVSCCGLTSSNLKTILHDLKLSSFKSIATHYEGDIHNFLISSTLEKLQCDFCGEKLMQLFQFNHRNLKNLIFFNWEIWGWDASEIRLSSFAPNLQVLYIPWRYLKINDCFELKSLRKVILDLDANIDINMSELLQLLKLENLKELTIDDLYVPNPDVDFSKLKAFKTNLQHLNIIREVFYALEDFCLDLLQLNRKLILTCFDITTDLVSKVLNNAKFPSRFKYINICGITIDCTLIRQQCKKTMELIELLVNTFSMTKCYFILE